MSIYKGQEKVLNSITAVEEAKVKEIIGNEMTDKGVCTTKVADVTRKTITNPSNVTSGTISYAISNGICSVEIIGITPDGTGGVTIPLPKSLYYTVGLLVDHTGTPVGSACGGTNGAFNIINISGTTALYGGFSYPVAE